MTFDILSFVIGKAAGGGGGSAVEAVEKTVELDFSADDVTVFPGNTLIEKQKQTFSASNIEGFYFYSKAPSPCELVLGEPYIVSFDGEEFECIAFRADTFAPGTIAVGNTLGVTGVNNGMPFCIGVMPYGGRTLGVYSFTGGEHTFAMYEDVRDSKLLSKVTIPKPDTLVAGNIAEGVTVAGILGTLSGGGGVDGIDVISGTLKATAQQMTFVHNWGKIPDIILVMKINEIAASYEIQSMICYSQAFIDAHEVESTLILRGGNAASNTAFQAVEPNGIDGSGWSGYKYFGGIREATANQFVIGGSTGGLVSGNSYYYAAIFGLT